MNGCFCNIGLEWLNDLEIGFSTYVEVYCHWSLSIPHENIRKALLLWCFQAVYKETSDMEWVNGGSVVKYTQATEKRT